MKKIFQITPFVLGATLLLTTASANTPTEYQEEVVRVVDGDTFEIRAAWNPYPNLEWKVRVLGIDTPEKGSLAKCTRERELSSQAQALTTRLVAENNGRVILRNVNHDKYGGRLDAEVVFPDGRTLATELLNARLAKPYNGSGPKPKWCF